MITAKKYTILIVEDEEYVRDFLSLLLKDRYEIINAADGIEAINKINLNNAIDLILLDLHMPGINGMDLLKALRKEVRKEIPVIIVTAYSSKDIRDEAMALGAKDFISKPFSIEILEKAIQKVLASVDTPGFA